MLRKDCLSGSINKNELMKIKCAQLLLLLFLLASCEWIEQRSSTNTDETAVDTLAIEQAEEPTLVEEKMPEVTPLEQLADTSFVRLADYSDQFAFDMRYATDNNFLKEQVYDCPECYTRTKTAKALIAANDEFISKGYRIQFFDCYRPNSVQYKMWKIMPNPQYVANPVKGSIHNKGGAVDITLVDMDGNPLDMGTDFDFFGHKAHHDHTDLPEQVLANRLLLKSVMEKHGFWSIRTEWWHYNLAAGSNDQVADFTWTCP